jgi:hypothetical protein
MASPVPGLQLVNHAEILFKAYNTVKEPLLKICLGSLKSKNTKPKEDLMRSGVSNDFKQVR